LSGLSGTLTFNTSHLTNNSTFAGETTLAINNNSGNIIADGLLDGVSWGSPQTVSITAPKGSLTDISVLNSSGGLWSSVYDVTITASGTVKLPFSSLAAVNPNNGLARMNIAGSSIGFSQSGAHVFTAYGMNGVATGSEGQISFTQTG